MNLPKVNLVFIGHKDHGKSTLIGRLLYDSKAIRKQKLEEIKTELKRSGGKFEFAFLIDSLEEERKGGLTIDIMHTPFRSKKYQYTIIDCPGHKEFIQKMLTGASEADAAVLVVSTKEGIENQTREHSFLIKTLGIKQLAVAINKMDMVNYQEKEYQKTTKQLKPILNSLGYQRVPMIPISAKEGENVFKKSTKMHWYQGPTLVETLDEHINPRTLPINKPLRGVIQDVYPYDKGQQIIACKIETGTLETTKEVIFNPSKKRGLLKKILEFGSERTKAQAGDSVGLIVEGINGIKRGEVLSYPQNQPQNPENFITEIILFSNFQIQKEDELTIRYGTATKKCKVTKILREIDPVNLNVRKESPEKLGSESVGELELTPLEPISIEKYADIPELGRFVIKGNKGTMGAGIILEINS